MSSIEQDFVIATIHIVRRLPDNFPFERITGMIEDAFANECYLAIESLCSNIDDFEIKITKDDYVRISRLAKILDLPESDWTFIKKHIATE